MKEYDLLEAMGGIRDEYIEEAAEHSALRGQDTDAVPVPAAAQGGGRGKRGKKILRMQKWAASLAAVLCLSILLPNLSPGASSAFRNLPLVGPYFRAVTFRSYEYQDENADAYVEEQQIVTMSAGSMTDNGMAEAAEEKIPEQEEAYASEDNMGSAEAGAGEETAAPAAGGAAEEYFMAAGTGADVIASDSGADFYDADAGYAGERADAAVFSADTSADSSVQALLSAAQITEEIRQMAAASIASFERNIEEETGFYTLRFLSGTVTDTAEWFCMRVLSYTASADGFEQVTHFVINKESGQRVSLADWFGQDVDYITPISENIREQMREQMAESNVDYWIDSVEDPGSDFKQIRQDQDFYVNDDGEFVICFDEMEVAPAYMGPVEFTIPREVTDSIRAE